MIMNVAQALMPLYVGLSEQITRYVRAADEYASALQMHMRVHVTDNVTG